ncbi:hypothetical protein V2G26_005738 [Clonostachys chloroleuca]|uniref:Heterokaryon incompatibility domain-containing protein n=1 Tax=Clonostachys chloroleuca TaxID=1926264 RepID=A0AA35QC48_9HYPO|nr:unnamed protein product [Clonostachys chloroleuca]
MPTTSANAPRPRLSYRRANFGAGEFRLLEVQRASNIDDRIVCRVITANLKDDIEFIALSSLYGDTTISEFIYIDNQRIPIPENIASGMRHVRAVFLPEPDNSKTDANGKVKNEKKPGGTPRWLVHALRLFRPMFDDHSQGRPLRIWFDALCIDHNNAKETQHQLVHMTQVYRKAKIVVGWLGPADKDSEIAVDTIKVINEIIPPNWGDEEDKKINPQNYSPQHEWMKALAQFWAEPETTEEEVARPDGVPNNYHWIACRQFLSRDYFNRHWILTEMGRARHPTFLAGTKILGWKHILRLTALLQELRDKPSNVVPPHLVAALHQFPLGVVYDFLADFDQRHKAEKLERLQNTQRSDNTQFTSSSETYT